MQNPTYNNRFISDHIGILLHGSEHPLSQLWTRPSGFCMLCCWKVGMGGIAMECACGSVGCPPLPR